jgi:hypothetical protein
LIEIIRALGTVRRGAFWHGRPHTAMRAVLAERRQGGQ